MSLLSALLLVSHLSKKARGRSLPQATFIHEALTLTMATGVRQTEEPQHQAWSPRVGVGNQEGQQVAGGDPHHLT